MTTSTNLDTLTSRLKRRDLCCLYASSTLQRSFARMRPCELRDSALMLAGVLASTSLATLVRFVLTWVMPTLLSQSMKLLRHRQLSKEWMGFEQINRPTVMKHHHSGM
ncbi:hypothetical protein CVT25_000124 [Psilocybe cyanescens]|uniref:Uncharacterized protein n=1 Tax=Psilocybe cyanescens TaxID=93625 RepID=A0A409W6Z0_PSICY|nr:hypothetical protein CVT25_000124 [Psilocybe cyanescens]